MWLRRWGAWREWLRRSGEMRGCTNVAGPAGCNALAEG